jgi:predicted DNA-binding transcriptional regulator AlpA
MSTVHAAEAPGQAPPPAFHPDQYINDDDGARLLGISRSYLRQMRVKGNGPVYVKLGAAVRYRAGDLIAWAKSRATTSTSAVA